MFSDTSQILRHLLQQVDQLDQEGRIPEAIELATRARDRVRESYGERHPDYAASLSRLARLYNLKGDHAEAGAPLQQPGAAL